MGEMGASLWIMTVVVAWPVDVTHFHTSWQVLLGASVFTCLGLWAADEEDEARLIDLRR